MLKLKAGVTRRCRQMPESEYKKEGSEGEEEGCF
jgi:hypothetical protein